MLLSNIFPYLSIIVVVDPKNWVDPLRPVIKSYLEQSVTRGEIEVFIMTGSREQYNEVTSILGNLKSIIKTNVYIHPIYCGETTIRARMLNVALKMSRGQVIYVVAGDFVLPQHAVAATIAFHKSNPDERMAGVGSAIVPIPLRSEFIDWLEQSGTLFGVPFYPLMDSLPSDFFYCGNVSFKKSLVNKVGYFDESFPYHAWDDWEMGKRLNALGMTTRLISETEAVHFHKITIKDRCRQLNEAGQSAKIFYQKNSSVIGPWSSLSNASVIFSAAAAKLYKLNYLIFRDKKSRNYYFRAETNHAFRVGYFTDRTSAI
jgi:hypothetical protein